MEVDGGPSVKRTHRKDGSFRAGNKAHSLPPGERRVVLPAQRVAPQTLATLQALAPQHGGIGRAIDALASGARPAVLQHGQIPRERGDGRGE